MCKPSAFPPPHLQSCSLNAFQRSTSPPLSPLPPSPGNYTHQPLIQERSEYETPRHGMSVFPEGIHNIDRAGVSSFMILREPSLCLSLPALQCVVKLRWRMRFSEFSTLINSELATVSEAYVGLLYSRELFVDFGVGGRLRLLWFCYCCKSLFSIARKYPRF